MAKFNGGPVVLFSGTGETQKGDPTFEFGVKNARFSTSHTAPIWERLFMKDEAGNLIGTNLVQFLETNCADFVTVEKGLEQFHKELGEYLEKRKLPTQAA